MTFHPSHQIALIAGCGLLIAAAWRDLATRNIPNILPALLFLAGLLIRIEAGNWRLALILAASVFAAGFALWCLRFVGGGDVKLLAAAAIFVAPSEILRLLALMSLLGGLLATVYLMLARLPPRPVTRRPRSALRRYWAIEHRRMLRRAPLPYAVAIAGAALATVIR